MCSSKKYPYSPYERDWNFLGGGRFCKAKKCKEMYEAWLEFPEGWRGPFHGGGMDIFWNYTMNKHLHAWMNFIIWKINGTLHISEQSWNASHGMILITPHYWLCLNVFHGVTICPEWEICMYLHQNKLENKKLHLSTRQAFNQANILSIPYMRSIAWIPCATDKSVHVHSTWVNGQ